MAPAPGHGTDRATSAGAFDATLGGQDHYPADEALAARLLEICPELGDDKRTGRRGLARINRDYLGSAALMAVAHLGITQFLDLGCGFPARGGVLESALAASGETRIACVDIDPDIADKRYGYQAVLKERGEEHRARMVLADLTKPEEVIGDPAEEAEEVAGHPEVTGLLDLGRPVMVTLGAVLHYWPAAEGRRIVAGYMDALPPGSAVALTVVACPDQARQQAMREAWLAGTGYDFHDLHSDDNSAVASLFGNLWMLNPGAGPVHGLRQAGRPRTKAYLAGGIGIKRKPLGCGHDPLGPVCQAAHRRSKGRQGPRGLGRPVAAPGNG